MPYADNDGVSLYYELGGPTDAPTVAFICGLGYARWMWDWQRDALADEYETLVWDNRGAGDSDAPEGPYTIETMAADFEAVLDAADREAVHIVGASMGGMIALQYALDFDRAESLALLCTSHGGPEAVPTPEETQHRMFNVPDDADEREAIRWKMAPAVTDEFVEANPDTIERIVDWRLETDTSEAARMAQAAGVEGFDVSDRLDELDLPVLVMHGTADEVLPVENGRLLHEAIPESDLELFEGAPHLFFIERADGVNDRLRSFLSANAGA
ncbi:MAG: alpha/beta fold hydrolase [Halodesulfurarchaeum sp.]